MEAGGHSKRRRGAGRTAALAPAASRSRSRVMLVEPRFLVRDCIANCLTEADPGFAVLQYSNVTDVDLAQGANPVALVLGLLAANHEFPDVAAEVSSAQDRVPNVPVVVVADEDELSFVRKVIGLGVRGYIPTSFDFAMFKEAIQFVAAGGTFVPASVLVRDENVQMSDADQTNRVVWYGDNEVPHQDWNETREHKGAAIFTPRELAVILRLRDGKPNKLIARELTICEGTVKLYVRRIMRKLGVENRTQAALVATHMQLDE
jgi:DNA-binding NarL/FixJ family response regulator